MTSEETQRALIRSIITSVGYAQYVNSPDGARNGRTRKERDASIASELRRIRGDIRSLAQSIGVEY